MKEEHIKLMRDNGICATSCGEVYAYEGLVDLLVEDSNRLWNMIETTQQASNDAGLLGMVGSPAWIAQIKKARK